MSSKDYKENGCGLNFNLLTISPNHVFSILAEVGTELRVSSLVPLTLPRQSESKADMTFKGQKVGIHREADESITSQSNIILYRIYSVFLGETYLYSGSGYSSRELQDCGK